MSGVVSSSGLTGATSQDPATTEPAAQGTHVCVLCEAKLSSKAELQDHFRKHANGEIDYKTKGGGKSSNRQSSTVNRNVRTNNVARQFNCDVCNAKFDNVTAAINHKYKQHPNCQNRYYCGFCGKQFPLEVCKQIHIDSEHKNDKKDNKLFKCSLCSVDFFSVTAVKFHINSSHRRVNTILSPVATQPPSKKIKLTTGGEPCNVYYCHLCGMEYMVKFNLQHHLENFHSLQERAANADELIKCKLCDAIFYNKKAYDAHNFHHKSTDLYINSEEDRKATVPRVDQDFDLSRVPTIWDKYEAKRKRKRGKQSVEPSKTQAEKSDQPSNSQNVKTGKGKNRALVDSDSENQSDSSDESDCEAGPSATKIPITESSSSRPGSTEPSLSQQGTSATTSTSTTAGS